MTALSSTCVAGTFTEDVGKPVHISTLPCRDLNPHLHYEII